MLSSEFAELLNILSEKSLDKKITLFMGSGCDYSSGGNSFKSLKQNVLNLFDVDDYTLNIKFNDFLKKATPEQKSALLSQTQNLEETLCPSEYYKLLILLLEKKIFSSVFTTNFYHVMEKAQESLNKDVLDIFSANSRLPMESNNLYKKDKIPYYKLHGDVLSHYVSHLTDDDLNDLELSSTFYHALERDCKENIIIFVGYSGEDPLLCKHIANWITDNKYIFFINPDGLKEKSHLALALGNERLGSVKQIRITFDEFILETSRRTLRNYQMTNNIVFIKPLIDIAINSNCIKSTSLHNYIPRKNLDNRLEDFLQSDKNLFVLSGYAGKGRKTYLSYLNSTLENEHMFIPIYCSNDNTDLVHNMANAIGYSTNDDISVIYQFSKWAVTNKYKFFFIYSVSDNELNKDSFEEYFQLIYRCLHIRNIKFLLSIDFKSIENNRDLFMSPLFRSTIYSSGKSCISFKLDDFTAEELSNHINNNFLNSNEIFNLLKEPAILSMFFKMGSSLPKMKLGKFSYISNYFADSNYNLRELKNYALSLYQGNNPIKLNEDSLIGPNGQFLNPLFFSYFLGKAWVDEKYFKPNISINNEYDYSNILNCIKKIIFSNENDYLMAMMFAVGESLSSLQISKICSLILNDSNDSNDSNENLFVQNLLNYLAINDTQKFSQIINKISNFPSIIEKVAYSCMYEDDNNVIEKFTALINNCSKNLEHEELRLIMQLFSKKCSELICVKNKSDDVFDGLLALENSDIQFLLAIKLLSDIGIDNTPQNLYNQLVDRIFKFIKNCNFNFNSICKYFKKYSSALMFNENNIVNAYALISQDKNLRQIIKSIADGGKLHERDFLLIMEYAKSVEASTRFFVLNIALLQLCQSAIFSVDDIAVNLLNIIRSDESRCVSQCDFLLSFVFLGSYLLTQRNNKPNEHWLKILLNDDCIEKIMFDMPGGTRAIRFTDTFDKQFEDGFNPFAFYFYIAPTYMLDKKNSEWDSYDKLSLYWSQSEKLKDNGHTHNILRFVHAVGQMIELWPAEGFEALTKFLKYDEPCIHRALVRLLQEYYVKFPDHTDRFLMIAGTYFTEEENKKIKSTCDTRLYTRSMEQLHWIRLLLFFLNNDRDFFKKILALFLEKHSFDDFFISTLQLIVHQDSDGIICQTN